MSSPTVESQSNWIHEVDDIAADAELSRALTYVELWTRLGGAPPGGFSAAECADELAYWSARAPAGDRSA